MGTVIVLITLLVGLLSGLTAGLDRQNTSAITGLPADRIAFGGAEASYVDSTVTERQWRQWAAAPGVTAAEPLGISTTRATAGGRGVAVSVFGVRPGSHLGPPGADLDDATAVLTTSAAADLGLRVGDRLTLAGRELTVAAVRGDASFSHTPVVWTSLDSWRRTTSAGPGAATVIALRTGPGVDVAATDRDAGTRTVTTADSVTAIGSYRSENGSLQLMRGFLFAISALVVGAFFTIWTIQRSGDVAVLKALGASTTTLLVDALGQVGILLVGGTVVGTAVAAGLGVALSGSDVPFVLTASTVVLPAAVLVLLGTAGAALAVRRITSVDPLTALGSAR
ncbi:ABC transporter permease [Micromonospora maritima]|uniref:ABC transporter permease n=1 Tax=Micromonospora maritima TaxID=986711 RepID=UPI001FE2D985|nr:ABC transporter permease [Micromonospora maritima]